MTELLGFDDLPNGTAKGYFTCLESFMTKRKLKWKDMVALGTDGCGTMRGHKTSLVALVKANVPGVATVHCVAHVLNLSILDSAACVTYLTSTFQPTMKKLFNFYHYSPKHPRELKEIAEVLDVDLGHVGTYTKCGG